MSLNKYRQGFTLVETTISIVLTFIISLTSLALVYTMIRSSQANQRLTQGEVVNSTISNELIQSVRWSNNFVITSDGLTMTEQDGSTTEFELQGTRLMKTNSTTGTSLAINPESVRITEFEVFSRAPDGTLPLLEINYTIEADKETIEVTKVISSHRDE